MQKVISTDKAPSAIGPYSQAIEINGMVYTSGVIPVIPATGEIAEGGVEAQAEQAFKNLCNLVEESGSKVENIVKTTVFIKEMILERLMKFIRSTSKNHFQLVLV